MSFFSHIGEAPADSTAIRASTEPVAVVVGCGVIGLTCAHLLQKHGFRVLIRTQTTPLTAIDDESYTSSKAGAHWFSFAGEHEYRKQVMDELAFQALSGLAVMEPNSGVSSIRGHALFDSKTAHTSYAHIPWWHAIVPRFRVWSAAELMRKSAETGTRYHFGYSYEAIMIHGPQYLLWLYHTFLKNGGEVQLGTLNDLSDAWTNSTLSPDVVVNCTGLGASTLGGVMDKTMYPDRGQVIRVKCDSITDIWRAPGPDATYVLPRGDGTVILGGTHVRSDSFQPDEQTAADILVRCQKLIPDLKDISKYDMLNHSVGLRPARKDSQRVEIDEKLSILPAASSSSSVSKDDKSRVVVHAYGHGGDGFQSSWGTAVLVSHLIYSANPSLFGSEPAFHIKYSQLRTNVLQRAGIQHPIVAKL